MTRKEEIKEQAKIAKREFIARFDWSGNQETGFQEGAKWADEQEGAPRLRAEHYEQRKGGGLRYALLPRFRENENDIEPLRVCYYRRRLVV